MTRCWILLFYNLCLPFVFLLALPAWVIKMKKRGGFGTGLLQRLGIFKKKAQCRGGVYIHAVSVGETLMAVKLIQTWQKIDPSEQFILVPTTATGHEVARKYQSNQIEVIYSPVDFPWIVRKVMRRYQPKILVLIEGEIWANLLTICKKMHIPVAIANTRLSQRSEARYKFFSPLARPILEQLSCICIQEKHDAQRMIGIGMPKKAIHYTGSIKYDHTINNSPKKRLQFEEMLETLSQGKKIIMLISTSKGEEKLLTEALLSIKNYFLVIVPRHMERRLEVFADLTELGYHPILRSTWVKTDLLPEKPSSLIIDSTGELRDWTAHADLAIIGKSWLGKGGQNPTESIAASVPVIVGKRMDNFEPLVKSLVEKKGIIQLESSEELANVVRDLLFNKNKAEAMTKRALTVLKQHEGATKNTVKILQNNAIKQKLHEKINL